MPREKAGARMRFRRALLLFLRRLFTLAAVCVGLYLLPDFNGGDILRYKNAAAALIFVVGLGKLLYDTLFNDGRSR